MYLYRQTVIAEIKGKKSGFFVPTFITSHALQLTWANAQGEQHPLSVICREQLVC